MDVPDEMDEEMSDPRVRAVAAALKDAGRRRYLKALAARARRH